MAVRSAILATAGLLVFNFLRLLRDFIEQFVFKCFTVKIVAAVL